ncbi:hypothetical protein ABZ897_07900 [Nonomuraea sp. NPDC046802]
MMNLSLRITAGSERAEGLGFSDTEAKREFGRRLRYPSWRGLKG